MSSGDTVHAFQLFDLNIFQKVYFLSNRKMREHFRFKMNLSGNSSNSMKIAFKQFEGNWVFWTFKTWIVPKDSFGTLKFNEQPKPRLIDRDNIW